MRRVIPALVLLAAGCASASAPRATTILSASGPLPVAAAFESASFDPTLLLAGSAWAVDGDVRLEVQVFVDGALVGRMRLFSNAPGTHRALVAPAIPLRIAPGRHRLELRAGNDDTVTDGEDAFEAALLAR